MEQRQWPNIHRTLETDQAVGEAFFTLLVRTMREVQATTQATTDLEP